MQLIHFHCCSLLLWPGKWQSFKKKEFQRAQRVMQHNESDDPSFYIHSRNDALRIQLIPSTSLIRNVSIVVCTRSSIGYRRGSHRCGMPYVHRSGWQNFSDSRPARSLSLSNQDGSAQIKCHLDELLTNDSCSSTLNSFFFCHSLFSFFFLLLFSNLRRRNFCFVQLFAFFSIQHCSTIPVDPKVSVCVCMCYVCTATDHCNTYANKSPPSSPYISQGKLYHISVARVD